MRNEVPGILGRTERKLRPSTQEVRMWTDCAGMVTGKQSEDTVPPLLVLAFFRTWIYLARCP